MKGVIAALLIFAGVLMAQTVTPWSGTEMVQFVANCTLHNTDSVLCVATDGVEFSFQGAAFVKVAGAQGPPGPAGPQGPQGIPGPTGAQGPPGPVQSFGTAKCPAWNGGSNGITIGPGCTETTP